MKLGASNLKKKKKKSKAKTFECDNAARTELCSLNYNVIKSEFGDGFIPLKNVPK